MSSGNLAILALTVKAAVTLATARFVTQAGEYPAAAAKAFGVTRTSGAVNDLVPVDVQGTAIAEAGGAFALDDALSVDAQGRVVKAAAGVGVARAMEAAAGAGALVEVLLTPSA